MALEALVLNSKDNVATAVKPLENGQRISVKADNHEAEIVLTQAIPSGHKLALKDIASGAEIIKYGEVIGRATAVIKAGEHVHVHNVEGLRGRGDRR